MSPDDISTSIEYISRIFREASPEEFSHRHLSYEAETLTVATFRVWKLYIFCQGTYFCFSHATYREEALFELRLSQA